MTSRKNRAFLIIIVLFSVVLEAKASVSRSIGWNWQQYFSNSTQPDQSNDIQSLRARIQWQGKADTSASVIDISGIYSMAGPDDHHLVIPELAWGKKWDSTTFVLGRQLFPWSRMDEQWQLSLWEPQFRRNVFHPERQGQVGAFLSGAQGPWQGMVFVSPLFVPDQGPGFTLSEGKFKSSNRGFETPPNEVQLGEGESDLYYTLERPSVEEVLLQESYGFWTRVGQKGPWVQLAWARKPINRLQLAQERRHQLALGAGNETHLRLHPLVRHHEVMSIESGWKAYSWEVFFSVGKERPLPLKVDSSWVQNPLKETQFYALGLEKTGSWQGRVWRLYSHGLSIQEAQGEDSMRSEYEDNLERPRFSFLEAYRVGGAMDWKSQSGQGLSLGIQYTFAPRETGGHLTGQFQFSHRRGWQAYLAVDILGVDDREANGFLSRHQAEDSFHGGLVYAF